MDEKEELVLINSFEGSAKVRNVRRDPRVALSIVETHNTYKMVSMKGKVVDVTMNDADNQLHKLAKYGNFDTSGILFLGLFAIVFIRVQDNQKNTLTLNIQIYFVFHLQHIHGE